jgi:hypothetical protein
MNAIPPYRRNNWQPRTDISIHLAPEPKPSIEIDEEMVEIVPPGAACMTLEDTVAYSSSGLQRLKDASRMRGIANSHR